ncbi:MAG TPA: class I SAM-dependent rRNA methyltransferase, partial [Polyangiaceae bacterium]|nr:class I SAM-dependent rRNA methyltransferase [Polyangiaceae bacterium]
MSKPPDDVKSSASSPPRRVAHGLPVLTLKPGHVQPLWAGHPWVFAQAVARWDGKPEPGAEVVVCDARGEPLGRALCSPSSAIVARVFSRDAECPIGAGLIQQRLELAAARRRNLGLPSASTTGLRAVHAEGDDLPGLIVDRLGDVLALQWGTIGVWQRREQILELLERQYAPRAIVDRSSARTAQQEGFVAPPALLRGDQTLSAFEFLERVLRFRIPLSLGQKTGFYFDQRPLRARIEELSRGRRVLDAYCYTGSLALAAARGGASSVVAVDTSGPALAVGAENAADNGLGGRIHFVEADALAELGRARAEFDLVLCDPPKLAPGRAARGRASEAMRRIARN